MRRAPQLRVAVAPEEPLRTYYNDLSIVALAHGDPAGALTAVTRMAADRRSANPTSIAQLGIGAWQLHHLDSRWLEVVRGAADALVASMEPDGSLPYLFPLLHTYPLAPPWCSAMAQGEAASLLVRASMALDEPPYANAAVTVVVPLLTGRSGLAVATPEGPVLQEYPTHVPSHVLNGWIFALWGLFDVAAGCTTFAPDEAGAAARSFLDGAQALERRLPLYRVAGRWSRYDLYPHPIVHVASPFYHRLHVEQLAVMNVLHPSPVFAGFTEDWERGARSTPATVLAVGRKGAFRMLRPRRPKRSKHLPGAPEGPPPPRDR